MRSEFEVHVFRGPQPESPHFSDEGEDSPSDEYVSDSEEEENSQQSRRFPSPARHNPSELSEALPLIKNLVKDRTYPGFCKRLTASNIQRSDCDRNSGQFHFPWSFVKTHGNQVQGAVKLQGIHEDSPTYSVTCRQRPQHPLRVYFVSTEWSRFVKKNGLKDGHELQFSLVDESYFVVRKV